MTEHTPVVDSPSPAAVTASTARVTAIVTQRERFGMTAESLESFYEHTPGVALIYVDGNGPARWRDYLRAEAEKRGFTLLRSEHFLTPNQARNIALQHCETDYVAFCDNDVLYAPGWLDRLVECADETGAAIVAPLTCQGLPAHSEIHHAGGDYVPGGATDRFFAGDPGVGRAFEEVMHGHADKVAARAGSYERRETGMCEFHCVLARRSVFDRTGPLDERMLSTKEHIDFSMMVKQSGGEVWFEPASVITYVFPCRARPMTAEDWPYFLLRWSDAYGRRSLQHFIAKWNLITPPDYVESKRRIYTMRRMQGIVIPLMRRVPLLNRSDAAVKRAARLLKLPERLVNELLVARQDRRLRNGGPQVTVVAPPHAAKAAEASDRPTGDVR